MKSEEILACLLSDDLDKQEQAYKYLFSRSFGAITEDGGSMKIAREVFQEAIASMIHKLNDNPSKSIKNVPAYLRKSCKYIYIKMKKKGNQSSDKQEDILENLPDNSEEEKEELTEREKRLNQMHECIKKLSIKCQKLLKGFWNDKKNDKELAKLLDYSENFVRQKRRRCMLKLKRCMELS